MESRESLCSLRSTPGGLERYSTGSPLVRNCTPWYIEGRKPLPQLVFPPLGPFCPELNTTNPGKSLDSLPSPYSVQAPKDGLPNCCVPVLIITCAGAWLKASVTSDFTIAMSSAIEAVCGMSLRTAPRRSRRDART